MITAAIFCTMKAQKDRSFDRRNDNPAIANDEPKETEEIEKVGP